MCFNVSMHFEGDRVSILHTCLLMKPCNVCHDQQVWTDNMTKTDDAKIFPAKGEDFTCVTFYPDLSKFKMEKLDKDIIDLFTRRAYDVVASARGVKVILNGVRLPVSTVLTV